MIMMLVIMMTMTMMLIIMTDRGFAWTRVRQRHAENDVKHVRLNPNVKSTSEASQEQAKHIINGAHRAALCPQPQLLKTTGVAPRQHLLPSQCKTDYDRELQTVMQTRCNSKQCETRTCIMQTDDQRLTGPNEVGHSTFLLRPRLPH